MGEFFIGDPPCGPGLGIGSDKVINLPGDLPPFQGSEILVGDAVDPNMTLVVPLACGIVERRNGMLIHSHHSPQI